MTIEEFSLYCRQLMNNYNLTKQNAEVIVDNGDLEYIKFGYGKYKVYSTESTGLYVLKPLVYDPNKFVVLINKEIVNESFINQNIEEAIFFFLGKENFLHNLPELEQ